MNRAAMTILGPWRGEECFGFVDSLGGEAHVGAVAQDQAPAAGAADEVADVVAEDGGDESDGGDGGDVEPAGAGVDGGGDQDGLPGGGNAEAFRADDPGDGEVAVSVE